MEAGVTNNHWFFEGKVNIADKSETDREAMQ
jgi:hypothetical protein